MRFAGIKETAELYKNIYSEAALRNIAFNRDINGFGCCVRKVGGRVIINLDEFEKWIESHKIKS